MRPRRYGLRLYVPSASFPGAHCAPHRGKAMIYLRCFCYETVMVALGPMMDLFDRHRIGRTRLYAVADGLYGRAWDALRKARTELEDKLSRRFPVVFEGHDDPCGCCR
jgi:hypothetical protein